MNEWRSKILGLKSKIATCVHFDYDINFHPSYGEKGEALAQVRKGDICHSS